MVMFVIATPLAFDATTTKVCSGTMSVGVPTITPVSLHRLNPVGSFSPGALGKIW
jgi:hypothetical protein